MKKDASWNGDGAPARRSILVIDNERTILFSLRRYLGLQGFAVDCATSWEEAEELLADRHYDVVITDLRLSGSDGVEGIDIIGYVGDRSPTTKTVLLTAYGTPAILDRAHARGVSAILAKPVSLDAVLQTLNSLLRVNE
ncbi:MAG: response regulator [Vicinamibacteria bacterium]|nr:response regulator [Vicinamibacteria bacterium]